MMHYIRIALYTFEPDTVDEVIQRAEAGMLPILHRQPGFVAYSVIKTGETSALSLSIWESREQAEAAIQVAASWVRQNIAGMVETVQNYIGEAAFTSDTTLPTGGMIAIRQFLGHFHP
jgi:heme-degrading monooxygenase HmoA